jgi:hypothetical protein
MGGGPSQASSVAGPTWIDDPAPVEIEPGRLDRVMLLGTPTTLPDGSTTGQVPEGPQAHLAIQGSETTPLPTHFHGVDQFQVFVRGGGVVGRHRVRRGVAHYADADTVYGPLCPGDEGMAYLTLRPAHDPGASFMPGARDVLAQRLSRSPRPPASRRNVSVDLLDPASPEQADPRGGLAPWISLLTGDDELRVALVTCPAHTTIDTGAVGGAGAYLLVLAGSVDSEAGRADAGALAWIPPNGSASGRTGSSGCRLALLQFPSITAGREA